MSGESKAALLGGVIILAGFILVAAFALEYKENLKTTYCTDWTRAVSIEPTNSDNGEHADEQYIVRYEDGSVDGQDQGKIPFARCTHKVDVPKDEKKPHWKVVNDYSGVDWEQ
jgi:hypothetical protein